MAFTSLKTKITALARRFKELQGSPSYLARGVAIGVFVGFAPIMPFKTLVILAMTIVLQGSTVAALLVCTSICNPITYAPLYYIAWLVGNILLPEKSSWALLETTIVKMQQSGLSEAIALAGQIGFDTTVVLLAGGLVLALPLALCSYPIAYRLFVKFSKKNTKTSIKI